MFEQKGDLRDAYILHKAIDESAIILGYFLLDNTHITSSSLFEILRQNTVNVEREDHLPSFIDEECIHLGTWVFDKQLGNEQ